MHVIHCLVCEAVIVSKHPPAMSLMRGDTGAGVVLLVVALLPVELVCVSMDTGLFFFLTIYTFLSKLNEQQLRLATYGLLVEFPRESNG